MKACIIAVGSEMLTPFRVDTNSLIVTDRLNAIGYDVRLKVVVGDDIEELAQVFASALTWADLIVVIGGLGPTDDDITRAAIAQVLEVPLDLHEARGGPDSRPVCPARHDDARDQPASGDGPARRDAHRQPQRHRTRPVDRARLDGDCPVAGPAA